MACSTCATAAAATTPSGSQPSSPNTPARPPMRLPSTLLRRRSSVTEASRGTTSPSWSCTGTARVKEPIHIGCSGWAYPHWRERLYPKGLPQRRWLSHYAERYDTVEVNSTFYRLASPSAVEAWVEQTPPGFLFAVKASPYLTHVKRLHNTPAYLKSLYE